MPNCTPLPPPSPQVSVMAVLQGSLFFGLKPDVEKVSTFFGAAFIMVGGISAACVQLCAA